MACQGSASFVPGTYHLCATFVLGTYHRTKKHPYSTVEMLNTLFTCSENTGFEIYLPYSGGYLTYKVIYLPYNQIYLPYTNFYLPLGKSPAQKSHTKGARQSQFQLHHKRVNFPVKQTLYPLQ